ncbi:MAG TPA: serine protease [Reyranella sp.]|nr:serine protease [Reyranella sp.]
MPSPAFIRRAIATLACCLALPLGIGAQELPFDRVSGAELRQALVWTGHLSLWGGDPLAAIKSAGQNWQASKGYAKTETLSEDQTSQLLAEAVKQRETVGWSMLEDKPVGLSIGVPTRLVKLASARSINGGTIYEFDGAIGFALGTRYGDLHCANMDALYTRMAREMRPAWKARQDDRFALFEKKNGRQIYMQAICRTSGIVLASITLAESQVAPYGVLFAAVADSLTVSRSFNPTAVPRPKVDEWGPGPGDLRTDVVARATSPAKLPPNVDGEGKASGLRLKPRDGPDLSPQEVFEKVAGAVYVVKADRRMGSAVAISETELLTNCHVVGDATQVTIGRDKKEQNAAVVSMNAAADRCVLRTDGKLAKWVSVRPYDDLKVGERAVTIGTPQGLELTVAEGIVSSKRSHKGSRLVQTSAPISQGSSGGGLFDAQGQLIGITTFYFAGGQNLNFAVAAEEFAK